MRKSVVAVCFMALFITAVPVIAQPNDQYQDVTEKRMELDDRAGEYLRPVPLAFKTEGPTYIGDTKNHIFHKAKCPYVKKISGKYKVYYYSRVSAVDEGFRPCPTCRP